RVFQWTTSSLTLRVGMRGTTPGVGMQGTTPGVGMQRDTNPKRERGVLEMPDSQFAFLQLFAFCNHRLVTWQIAKCKLNCKSQFERSKAMKEVLSLIFGGGRGSRLFPLTMLRRS